ncbi:MAG TPA: serine hydrolase domain-containing protein [Gemmatimonadales bacterium]|nr:serine hydrolase domain-containing protein [Gemmatimonadales bacterium]
MSLALLLVGCLDADRSTGPSPAPSPAVVAAVTTGFAWGSATPESQGLCGSALQLGCTRTLASIWSTISDPKFNTMRLVVIRNDKVVYDRGGTLAYPAYSSNKGLLGAPTLVHAMSSCGVGLTDPAANWLSGGDGARWATTWPWTEITVEQLATHTSGVCDYSNTSPICRDENGRWQRNFERAKAGGTKWPYPNDIFTIARAKAEQNRSPAAPGTVFEYSNVGHALLNYVVQQACGQSLATIYSQYIRQAGMGLPVAPAQIYTDGGRIWNQSAGIARWKGRDGAAVLRLAARLGIWDNRNVEPVRYWDAVTRVAGDIPAAVAAGRGVVYTNNGTDRWTATAGHRRFSNQLFGHNGNYSTIFLTDPLTGTTVVRQGKNNATGASYLTLNGCQPGWTGTAPSCTAGTDWSNNWGVAEKDAESATIGPRTMVMDPVQEAFFFPPPFCRMTGAGENEVDQVTDVYQTPPDAAAIALTAEIRVNPREGDGASVADRVEFYQETGAGAPTLMGIGTPIEGSEPAAYQLLLAADRHGTAGSVATYFANCVARSTVDSSKQVPSYSRPVRIRRGS